MEFVQSLPPTPSPTAAVPGSLPFDAAAPFSIASVAFQSQDSGERFSSLLNVFFTDDSSLTDDGVPLSATTKWNHTLQVCDG
ncbi:hypothetical protein L2E82_16180 [Cichorium intybus]|uniref:Uncharacterized protein n=1 Tax=Cichorium intybus TaxID=13427 RepID=A0ACB9F5E0_CICIN|nr:hypothetical protein L2E82_16180 [Cichorium intybus]